MLSRRPMWLFIVGLIAATCIGAWAAIQLVNDQAQQKRDNELLCEAINANSSTIRNLLVAARNTTPPHRLTPRARRFYRQQIAAITPLDCDNFNRETLRREQERRKRISEGGDAPSAGKPGQQPP